MFNRFPLTLFLHSIFNSVLPFLFFAVTPFLFLPSISFFFFLSLSSLLDACLRNAAANCSFGDEGKETSRSVNCES